MFRTGFPRSPPINSVRRVCANGHEMDVADDICLTCGADVARGEGTELTTPERTPEGNELPSRQTAVDGWQLVRRLPSHLPDLPYESFHAQNESGREAILTLYQSGAEPDPAVHEILLRMPRDHIPELIATGRYEGGAYEVIELISGGTLAEAGFPGATDPALLRRIVDELGRALASFAEVGLRHRDLNPNTIRLRTLNPLDLVITGFGSARLSDFDLEAVAPLELTRYSAPEAIVGAVSAASDWWSLGMIVQSRPPRADALKVLTIRRFGCTSLHVGSTCRRASLPRFGSCCGGFLARDPLKRWSATHSSLARWRGG